MEITDKKHFAILLATMGELYQTEIKPELIDFYWQTLKNHSWGNIKTAISAHTISPKQGRFFPKPADILALIKQPLESRSEIAWNAIVKAISEIGAYSSVKFDDPVIHYAIRELNGWVTLCRANHHQLATYREQFKKIYQECATQKKLPQSPPHFRGLLSCHNQLRLDEPIFIKTQKTSTQITQQS